MSRIISRAESWQKAYEAFQNVNFSTFDYATIKESMVDYIKIYFPETFNDYIESSEFIAILELFAYSAELMAYRLDLNAHENFLTTAQRKQSVLRLAKLISYQPSRNLPARGLVKLTSITTSERIFDSNGINLANTKIFWNDANNTNWKEQFLLVMNRVLQQEFGSVTPSDRIQVNDVLFELYTWNNNTIANGVLPFSATVSGESVPMELVPSALNEFGPYEKRPEILSTFSLLYGSDGLGDASDTTGFFIFAKQGNIQKSTTIFDGVTPNQSYDIDVENINETDIWVNNVDQSTGEILDEAVVSQSGVSTVQVGRYGEWQEVDLSNAQNIAFNTNPNRNKYEVETLEDDKVRLIFGDSEFADIPSGSFDIWFRTSLNRDIVVPQNAVVNKSSSFPYQDDDSNTQTFSFDFSLINTLQNASPSEDIEHIRRVAPSVYYAQDRMVNNRDYNTFMLQDPTILKLRAVNRTFAGDSKYIAWHDGSESYENVKLFSNDLVLYYKDSTDIIVIGTPSGGTELVENNIEPLLSSTDFFTYLISEGMDPDQFRTSFREIALSFDPLTTEKEAIVEAIDQSPPVTVQLYYSITANEWTVGSHGCVGSPLPIGCSTSITDSVWMITIEPVTASGNLVGWNITYRTRHLVAESATTKFWNTNSANRVIEYDTLNSVGDRIVLLKANEGYNDIPPAFTGLLSKDWNFEVLGLENDDINAGLQNIHQLSVLPEDLNEDGVADFTGFDEILDLEYDVDFVTIGGSPLTNDIPSGEVVTFPIGRSYLMGQPDNVEFTVSLVKADGSVVQLLSTDWTENSIGTYPISNQITVTSTSTGDKIRVTMIDYVYFNRLDENSEWELIPSTDANKALWAADDVGTVPVDSDRYMRAKGRSDLNFAWFHVTPRFHLVDPAATNIIDTFIISRGYYTSLRKWLDGKTTTPPEAPTSLQLRTDYNYLLDNKMISDTVILHSGTFKILFGQHAPTDLQGLFKVIRTTGGILTDNQVKVTIVDAIKEFFDVNKWEFGETFFYTELASHIHNSLPTEIDSVVLVPTHSNNQFGDLFQVYAREDEILQPSISVSDIEIIPAINSLNIRQNL